MVNKRMVTRMRNRRNTTRRTIDSGAAEEAGVGLQNNKKVNQRRKRRWRNSRKSRRRTHRRFKRNCSTGVEVELQKKLMTWKRVRRRRTIGRTSKEKETGGN